MVTKTKSASGYQFGTFQGVFTPNILTILGVIMYLRFGWVMAQVGLAQTLIIVTISTAITLLTAFSISQMATNTNVGAGGAYHIISRSLGIQAGAAIGIPLFLGQSLSIAFYVTGFAESLAGFFPQYSIQMIGVVTLLVIGVIAYISADFALKIQLLIMAMIALSLVSFFLGDTQRIADLPAVSFEHASFWAVFAVFFPAVTGILSGLSMSGDLKEPAKAIPAGTIAAVIVSYVIYMAIPFYLYHLHIRPEVLAANPMIMKHVAKWDALILLGLWGASLSSAIGSILGAPRTLQALARDNIVFKSLGRGYGRNKDPRLAMAFSFCLGLAGVLLSSLDMIATILTMFFLTTYGLLNFSAAVEGLIQNPSWRPSFRMPWVFPLIGAVGCFTAMLLINVGATLAAIVISAGIYILTHQRRLHAYWGDMKYAILMLITRFAVYRLVKETPHEKSWKPNILVLSGSPSSRWQLIALADAISHGKGFLTVATVLSRMNADAERMDNMKKSIQSYLKERHVPAVVAVHRVDEDVMTGARRVVEHYGFGPLVPNTLLMGVSEKKEHERNFCELILTGYRRRKNIILVHEAESIHDIAERQIDVWWRRGGDNAGLMLALAYLLMTSPEWQGATLTLKTVIPEGDDIQQEERHLTEFLRKANIEARIEVLVSNDAFPLDRIRESSRETDFVLLGLRPPGKEETAEHYAGYYASFIKALAGFPATALVMASEQIDFQKIFELHEAAV